MVGLGEAGFRLPLLIGVFGFVALAAVIAKKAMSLIVVLTALPARLAAVPLADVTARMTWNPAVGSAGDPGSVSEGSDVVTVWTGLTDWPRTPEEDAVARAVWGAPWARSAWRCRCLRRPDRLRQLWSAHSHPGRRCSAAARSAGRVPRRWVARCRLTHLPRCTSSTTWVVGTRPLPCSAV